MTEPAAIDPADLVRSDEVHRSVYVDQRVFDLEMSRIFEQTWIYCGHESQVARTGDYHAVRIGNQELVLVRSSEQDVNVLFNRCPHRGVELFGSDRGRIGAKLVCPYHAWSFDLDGRFRAMPEPAGYDGTGLDPRSGSCDIRRAPRVRSYRGFVFASLAASGPTLEAFLGDARIAFDDMCNRAPDGEVEVVDVRHRVVQQSNWKLFMENQLDAVHASFTHQSAGRAAVETERVVAGRTGVTPTRFKPLSSVMIPMSAWDAFRTRGFPHGHCLLSGYLDLRPDEPEQKTYEKLLKDRLGEVEAEAVLSRNIHHVLIYPSLSVQPAMQQLRVIRPLSPTTTLSELWHFRLKGAPEGIYRRALNYFNVINSPATLVNADDLENWTRAQRGLSSAGGDWVSFHRDAGRDEPLADGGFRSTNGLSEGPMRHQFSAWRRYMAGARS
ncbi:MAG: aromatic ring-hydroxylating dioxygenase subunit alpha [Lautropia sp.]